MSRDDDELLPLLSAEAERDLAAALRAAWQPEEIDPELNEALIALAIEDPLAPASDEEVAESERLRRALEGEGEHPYAELARALAAAKQPAGLAAETADRLAGEAAADPDPGPSSAARRGNVIYVAFGAAAAALALAASIALFIRPLQAPESAEVAGRLSELAVSRSTASLFHEKFETGATTERVDRIADARARELRSNRYAMWGVR